MFVTDLNERKEDKSMCFYADSKKRCPGLSRISKEEENRITRFQTDDMVCGVGFSDDSHLEAGVGSHLSFYINFLREDNKLGSVELHIYGRHLNDQKCEGELAEKIREFVKELKALSVFATTKPAESALPKSEPQPA